MILIVAPLGLELSLIKPNELISQLNKFILYPEAIATSTMVPTTIRKDPMKIVREDLVFCDIIIITDMIIKQFYSVKNS